jgi:coproporphyrinogen III oxidase
VSDLFARSAKFFSELQNELCHAFSDVDGAADFTTDGQGRTFRASGVSLVLHLHSSMIPTTHTNFRV